MNRPALRPYQQAAVREVVDHLHERPVLAMPTGSGKTVTAAAIVREWGRATLWIAHRRELIQQAADSLRSHGLPCGVILADHDEDRTQQVQVASVQTLVRRDLPPAELLVIDEAHHARAETYERIVAAYPEADVLGLTATPYRLDGKGLGDIFGRIVAPVHVDELIDAGFLVDPIVYAPGTPDLSRAKISMGDYREADIASAMNRVEIVGKVRETWIAKAEGRRTVAFTVNIAHSEALVASFREAGIVAEHVDGSTPKSERDAILARLRSGETTIVANCMVLTEGWDLPALEVAIIARPTASLNLHLQMLGRIMRAVDGKRSAIILDHAGNTLRHGLVTQRVDFTLADGVLKDRERGSSMKRCPGCTLLVPNGTRACPDCGHKWEAPLPVETDGELVAYGTRDREDVSFDEQREAWDRLVEWAAAMHFKPGWCFFRFKERFGFSPVVVGDQLVDVRHANRDEKRAIYEGYLGVARTRGYRDGWAAYRYRDTFGVWPRFGASA